MSISVKVSLKVLSEIPRFFTSPFDVLAERCNFIAMCQCQAIVLICRLSVCRLQRECIVTKRLKLGSCSF